MLNASGSSDKEACDKHTPTSVHCLILPYITYLICQKKPCRSLNRPVLLLVVLLQVGKDLLNELAGLVDCLTKGKRDEARGVLSNFTIANLEQLLGQLSSCLISIDLNPQAE